MRHTASNTKGFTLIEILVVIAIIGVLVTVVVASIYTARQKARVTKMKQEVAQIVRSVEIAKTAGYTNLISMTGNACTYCGGPTESVLAASLLSLATKADTPGLEKITRDPWGAVYGLDENEAEFGPTDCRRDYISSSSGGSYAFEYVSAYCLANPIGVAGWQ